MDCDYFPSSDLGALAGEDYLGTHKYVTCAATPTAGDECAAGIHDAWPFDFNDDRLANGQDTGQFGGAGGGFNKSVSQGPFYGRPGQRYDFNGNGIITSQDTGKYGAVSGNAFNKTCNIGPAAPTKTTGWYMNTVDLLDLDELACDQASAGEGGAVVLFFGAPKNENYPTDNSGEWGVELYGYGYVSIHEIRDAAIAFLQGYIRCHGSSTPYLFLMIGTSSYDGFGGVGMEHGEEWAVMLDEVNAWINYYGYPWLTEALGATDMELGNFDEDWAQSEAAMDWTTGFAAVANLSGYVFLGDAGGCPPAPGDDCNGDWTPDALYYVSSMNSSAFVAVPQNYRRDNLTGAQWRWLFDYSRDFGGIVWIGGTLTQYGACHDGNHQDCINDELDNPADVGYDRLYVLFFSDTNAYPQPMGCSMDMVWRP